MVKQYRSSQCFMFVPMVMVVERGNARSVFGHVYSQFCDTVLCVSFIEVIVNTSGPQIRWAEKHMKVVLLVKERVEL